MTVYQESLARVVAAKDRLQRVMPRNPDVLALIAAVDALVKVPVAIHPDDLKGAAKGERHREPKPAAKKGAKK